MPDQYKKRFLILAKSYHIMITEGYNDPKACAILGTIQPVLPEFLAWLQNQKSFKEIEELPLRDFVSGMKQLAPLGESALKELIKKIEALPDKPEEK